MMSARRFARINTSFWANLLPFSEGYVRALNEEATSFGSETPHVEEARATAVGELSYLLASESTARGRRPAATESEFIDSLADRAQEYLSRFPDESGEPIDDAEKAESLVMAQQAFDLLVDLVPYHGAPVVVRPSFPGYGLIDECEGDLRIGDCLCEFKAVTRPFRGVDLRQVLTYLALSSHDDSVSFTHVLLINQRRATSFQTSTEHLVYGLTGRSETELFEEVLDFALFDAGSGQ